MTVLAGGLERGVAGKHPVNAAVWPGDQLLHLGLVTVGRRLDQLLHHVARHVRLEQFLEQGGESLATAGTGQTLAVTGHLAHGGGVVGPGGAAHLHLQVVVVVDLLHPPDLAQGRGHGLRPLAVTALQDLHPVHVGADLHEVPHTELGDGLHHGPGPGQAHTDPRPPRCPGPGTRTARARRRQHARRHLARPRHAHGQDGPAHLGQHRGVEGPAVARGVGDHDVVVLVDTHHGAALAQTLVPADTGYSRRM